MIARSTFNFRLGRHGSDITISNCSMHACNWLDQKTSVGHMSHGNVRSMQTRGMMILVAYLEIPASCSLGNLAGRSWNDLSPSVIGFCTTP